MADILFIAITIAFFAICALYVQWCDRIIGPDTEIQPSDGSRTELVEGPDCAEVPERAGVTA